MVHLRIRRTKAVRRAYEEDVANLAGWTRLTQSELRTAQTEILSSFADFCAANQLSYFLYAGTLLGSVRHEGFIPWDDDIDVVMPRRDYDRLHSIASEHAAINGFSLCSPTITPGFPWPFAKIANNPGTLSCEDDGVDYRIGINIDVFPLDGWPSDLVCRWVHHQSLRLLRALILSRHRPVSFKRSDLREFVLVLAKPVAKLVPLDWLIHKVSSRASRYSVEDSGLVGVVVWGYPERVTARAYSNIVELRFGERRYRAPSGYDAILSAKYGNYMRLPPPELQVAPHAIEAFRSAN
jgi:lipopolysaccharide cholinephosphotransferase